MSIDEASAWVDCDGCGDSIEVGMIEMANGTFSVGEESFLGIGAGWIIEGGEHLCPDCQGDEEE